MANQCEQIIRLLTVDGARVTLVRTNAPYRPQLVGRVPLLRAVFRLLPYLANLWRALGQVEVVHVFANSGWAWHLLAMPALLLARWRGVATIVNYRGGGADRFFATAPRHVLRALASATLRVTPSAYLLRVFAKHGLAADVIPNVIDLSRFSPRAPQQFGPAPHLIVTRNLEPIYDISTALRAFALVQQSFAQARLTVAGVGPERDALINLTQVLGVQDRVAFVGHIPNSEIGRLYDSADLMLNASTVDNMPISILEALASGVPVVSTCAGGIPDMVVHAESALLVPVGDYAAMAVAALHVLQDRQSAAALTSAGLAAVRRYAWEAVMPRWRDAYWRAANSGNPV